MALSLASECALGLRRRWPVLDEMAGRPGNEMNRERWCTISIYFCKFWGAYRDVSVALVSRANGLGSLCPSDTVRTLYYCLGPEPALRVWSVAVTIR